MNKSLILISLLSSSFSLKSMDVPKQISLRCRVAKNAQFRQGGIEEGKLIIATDEHEVISSDGGLPIVDVQSIKSKIKKKLHSHKMPWLFAIVETYEDGGALHYHCFDVDAVYGKAHNPANGQPIKSVQYAVYDVKDTHARVVEDDVFVRKYLKALQNAEAKKDFYQFYAQWLFPHNYQVSYQYALQSESNSYMPDIFEKLSQSFLDDDNSGRAVMCLQAALRAQKSEDLSYRLFSLGCKKKREHHYQEAHDIFSFLAEKNDGRAQCELGICYLKGLGVDVDHERAFSLFVKAYKNGSIIALNNIGYCFYYGIGQPEDKEVARVCYMRSAERGCTGGEYNMALMLKQEGKQQAARELLKRAGGKGHRESQQALGRMWIEGEK